LGWRSIHKSWTPLERGTELRRSRHSWDAVFWLGFPALLGLLWLHQNAQHVVTWVILWGSALAYILYAARSLSRSTPDNALLSTYARIRVSMAFAILLILCLQLLLGVGAMGYFVVLGLWMGFHLLARAFVAWLTPKGGSTPTGPS
jgi:hypothetical protein